MFLILFPNRMRDRYLTCAQFLARHADKVAQYVGSSQWGQQMDIQILTNSYCQSAGDALREIDCMGVIRSDPFVLISDGVISNINLRRVIAKHKKAKKLDPMRVMTMCFKEADPLSGLRPVLDELVIGLDSETEQVCGTLIISLLLSFLNNSSSSCDYK